MNFATCDLEHKKIQWWSWSNHQGLFLKSGFSLCFPPSSLPQNTCSKTEMHIICHELFIDLHLISGQMQVYKNRFFKNIIFTFSALYSIPENLNVVKFLVLLEIALFSSLLLKFWTMTCIHPCKTGSHWIQMRNNSVLHLSKYCRFIFTMFS